MFGLGPWEIGLVLLIILMVFGAGKLPSIMGQLGNGLKTFKQSLSYDPSDDKDKGGV